MENYAYRKHGVVGVEEDVGGDRPGLIPGEVFLIEKNAHQLGNSEGGVGLMVFWSAHGEYDYTLEHEHR